MTLSRILSCSGWHKNWIPKPEYKGGGGNESGIPAHRNGLAKEAGTCLRCGGMRIDRA